MRRSSPLSTKNAGFSLVELSIVLVILGLLVGGVLVGQTLIKSAQLRAQIDQIKSFQTGINTFRLKYGGLPGDIDNATRMFHPTEWPDIENGNGNEKISDADGDYVNMTGEILQFWMQLGAAKTINGTYTGTPVVGEGFPENAAGRHGTIAVYDSVNLRENVFYIGITSAPDPGTDDAITGADSLTPDEAQQIDAKFDDGHPLFGNVMARSDDSDAYNDAPGYYEPTASNPLPTYAGLIMNAFISSAHAALTFSEACVTRETLGSAQESDENAYYSQENINIACQLIVKME